MEFNYKYILYLSEFIWVLPVFRQRGTEYYYMFFMYALIAPSSYITYYFIVPNMYLPTITFSFAAFVSLFEINLLKKKWYYFAAVYLLFFWGYVQTTNWKFHAVILCIIGLATILMLAHKFILSLMELKFNMFVLVIIAYLFLQSLQGLLFVLVDFSLLVNFTYFKNIFDILIAVFFIIFRADNDRFFIRL